MDFELLTYILFYWSILGFLALITLILKVHFIGDCPNCDFFMPTYIYKHCKVNWFGAAVLCLFINILCPVWSIGFWFYKLCTVGRK